MFKIRTARSGSQRGAAFLEATLVIPLFVLLTIGATDFGLAYWNLSTAQASLRNVTRYLSKLPSSQLCGALTSLAKNLAVYGKSSPTGTDKPLVAGWQSGGTSNITIVVKEGSTYNGAETTGCTSTADPKFRRITMSATVPYNSLGMRALGLPASITISTSHEERWIGQ